MTLIPTDKYNEWHAIAKRGARELLAILIEFRDVMMPDFKAEGVLMVAYAELAKCLMRSPDTLRDKIGNLRSYPSEKLLYWFDNDISFDHLDKSNQLAELAHKTPARLLDEAVTPGNAIGETMTVKELTSYALGEVAQPMKASSYRLTVILNQLRKFHTDGWEADKVTRFEEWREAGREFLE
jgi:hypothetical protein